jgi:hypothetical protein
LSLSRSDGQSYQGANRADYLDHRFHSGFEPEVCLSNVEPTHGIVLAERTGRQKLANDCLRWHQSAFGCAKVCCRVA